MPLKVMWFGDIPVRYREGTTDERVLVEVIDKQCYRKVSVGFEVLPGERWLDLGANIGAFAVYCRTRGATAYCFEPEPECYSLLARNAPWFECVCSAVTSSRRDRVRFAHPRNPLDHYRGSAVITPSMTDVCEVPNLFAGELGGFYDGVKMDIEGSEFGLIDSGLIPPCSKLCLEYHTSRDPSAVNLGKRLETLKRTFEVVSYPPEYDRRVRQGGSAKTYFDRMIFCLGRKSP